MEFNALPTELLVKIFSYLSLHSLLTAARVSRRWNKVALDPLLWTEFKIDSTVETETITLILGRAIKLRKLDITECVAHVGAIAPDLPRFQELKQLAIDKNALASDVMLTTLGRCESLTTLVITGDSTLCENDIAVLKTLPWLTSVVISGEMEVSNNTVNHICLCCPLLESLKLKAFHYSGNLHTYLKNLRLLRSLSLTYFYTRDLLPLSNSCPNLECLELFALNAFLEPRAKTFDQFLKLKRLTVYIFKGYQPSDSSFRVPPSLEWLDVPGLKIENSELEFVVQSCKESLRHVVFNATRVARSATEMLSSCENLKSVHLHGLSGNIFTLPTLWKFSNLVRATLTVNECATGVIYQLLTIVEVFDTSSKGHAKLILNMFCLSETSNAAMTRALTVFKEFLAWKACVSKEHIRDMEEQYLRASNSLQRVVSTSFPVKVKTLKRLDLYLRA